MCRKFESCVHWISLARYQKCCVTFWLVPSTRSTLKLHNTRSCVSGCCRSTDMNNICTYYNTRREINRLLNRGRRILLCIVCVSESHTVKGTQASVRSVCVVVVAVNCQVVALSCVYSVVPTAGGISVQMNKPQAVRCNRSAATSVYFHLCDPSLSVFDTLWIKDMCWHETCRLQNNTTTLRRWGLELNHHVKLRVHILFYVLQRGLELVFHIINIIIIIINIIHYLQCAVNNECKHWTIGTMFVKLIITGKEI